MRVLGQRSIARDARLVGVSLGLVMATFAVVVTAAVTHRAINDGIVTLVHRFAEGDVQVVAKEPLPAGTEEDLRALPHVRAVTTVGFGGAQVVGGSGVVQPVALMAVDPATYEQVSGLQWRAGGAGADAALRQARGVAVAAWLADQLGVGPGDGLRVDGPHGPVPLRVAGVFQSFGSAGLVVNTATAAADFGITNRFAAFMRTDDGTAGAVAEALAVRFPHAEVEHTDRIIEGVQTNILSLFSVAYTSLLLGALLCTVGLGASMSASVIRRAREFRLLRSVGTSTAQVRRMLLWEALTMVVLGCTAALPLGWGLARVIITLFNQQLGTDMALVIPVPFLVAYPLLVVPLALAAAVLPARRATRIALV